MLETIFQIWVMERNAKEREAVKNLSNRLAKEVTGRYQGAIKNPKIIGQHR